MRVPPVPIPNTEVKPHRAESTWRATAWEDRSSPGFFMPALLLYSAGVFLVLVGRKLREEHVMCVGGEDVLSRRFFERSFDALLYSPWVYLSILSCG